MAKSKLKTFDVRLFGTLPCSTTFQVRAENEEEAKQVAMETCDQANWDGADYNTPEGSTVEAGDATEV